MFSVDVENIITNISTLRDALALKVIDLIKESDYRIQDEPHFHSLYNPVYMGALAYGDTPTAITYENRYGVDYQPLTTAEYVEPIRESYTEVSNDINQMRLIDGSLYESKENVTNSYGSPWSEFDNLKYVIEQIYEYEIQCPLLEYSNEKRALIELMQLAIICCNDCKWAIIYYHDIIARGYSEMFNDGKEPVEWETNTAKNKNAKKGSNFYNQNT